MVTCRSPCSMAARSAPQAHNRRREACGRLGRSAADATWAQANSAHMAAPTVQSGGGRGHEQAAALQEAVIGYCACAPVPHVPGSPPHLLLLPNAMAAGHGLQVILRVPVCGGGSRGRDVGQRGVGGVLVGVGGCEGPALDRPRNMAHVARPTSRLCNIRPIRLHRQLTLACGR